MPAAGATARSANLITDLFTTAADPLRIEESEWDALPLSLSIVVPTLEEAANIGSFLSALHAILNAIVGEAFEIILVDDNSADATCHYAAELALPRVRVFRRHAEHGVASAVIRGWQAARGRILGTINADFQHPPEILASMLSLASTNDVVVASRYCAAGDCREWTVWRRFTSRSARLIGRAVLPQIFRRSSDPLSGCYLVQRRAVAGLEFRPAGYKTLIEILARARVERIGECGYSFSRRRNGRSKASPAQAFHYIHHLLRLRHAVHHS